MPTIRTIGSVGNTVRLAQLRDLLEASRYEEELLGYAKAGNRVEERLECTNRDYLPHTSLEESDEFFNHTIRQHDRIDRLAFNYLGDARLWWVLVDLNPNVLKDALYLPLNQQIRIPTQSFLTRMRII